MRASNAPTSFKKNRTNRRENDRLDPDGAAWSFIAFPREQLSQRAIPGIVSAFRTLRVFIIKCAFVAGNLSDAFENVDVPRLD
jgi:hypothetical protein